MWEWLRNALGGADSEPQPPVALVLQQSQPPVITQVTIPGLKVSFDEMMAVENPFAPPGWRNDSASTVNPFTGVGGGGDKGAAARPNVYWTPFTSLEKKVLFRRAALARRMCWIYPEHSFRRGFSIDVAKKGATKKAKRVQKVAEDLGFNLEATKAGTFANRDSDHYLLGIFDEEPNWVDPLTGLPAVNLALPPRKINKVLQLQAFERDQTAIAAWDWSLRDKNYFKPLVFSFYPAMGSSPLYAHNSRVLWFRGSELSGLELYGNAGFDDSLLDSIYDELRAKLQIGQIGATVAQELGLKYIKIAGKSGASSEDQARTFWGRLSMFWRSLGAGNVAVLAAEDEIGQVGSTITGFGELSEEAWTALAAISDIPRTVLTGEPPGGLNADGQAQRENWHSAVHSRQKNKFEPLVKQFLGWVWETEGGAPEEWAVRWSPLDQPTDKEVAEIRKLYSEADERYLKQGVLLPATVAQSRFGSSTFGTEIVLEDDVAEAKRLGNLALAAQRLLEKNAEAQGAGSPGTGGGPRKTPKGESET